MAMRNQEHVHVYVCAYYANSGDSMNTKRRAEKRKDIAWRERPRTV